MELRDKIALWYAGNTLKPKNGDAAASEESVHEEFTTALQGLEPKTIEVYYTDIFRQGANKAWMVDLSNDEINRRVNLPWTWTVMTRKMLDGTGIVPRPWMMVIGPCSFSIPLVESVINTWAIEKGYAFNIRLKKQRA